MRLSDTGSPVRALSLGLGSACILAFMAGHSSFARASSSGSDAAVLSEIRIQADGPDGMETYEIFRQQLGETCIEAPDIYPNNHLGDPHIIENTGGPFGSYFTFLIHRDHDEDKNDDGSKERQRNEVRGDNNSPDLIKAISGEIIRYHWYFRIDPAYRGNENHTIFFQLHNVDVGPILKIQSYKDDLAIRHDPDNGNDSEVVLASHPFDPLKGQWLEVEVVATFSNRGYLRMSIRDEAGAVVMHTERFNIDMWTTQFTRPKWGIYRALDRNITNSEDRVDFANFTIQALSAATPTETRPSVQTGVNLDAYPNPFADRTTIAVTLDGSASAHLDVYDLLGRRVATLVDSFLPRGRSEVSFVGDGLASGLYTLSLRADGRAVSRTVIYQPDRSGLP